LNISVIILALNEAAEIKGAIEGLTGAGGAGRARVEVIVADGGSVDDTTEAALSMGATVVESPPGRGLQMDRASSVATGDVLLFLHADTRLPPGWYLEDAGVVGGAFNLAIDSPKRWFRMVEWVVRVRSRWFGLMYGDQAIFARRKVFFKLGGYKGLPLMEDVDLIRRLKRQGKVVCIDKGVIASVRDLIRRLKRQGKIVCIDKGVIATVRRWAGRCPFQVGFKNWLFLALYFTGVSPRRLYSWYYGRTVN
jgi:rSAM/selenodomain-associated transferase 2